MVVGGGVVGGGWRRCGRGVICEDSNKSFLAKFSRLTVCKYSFHSACCVLYLRVLLLLSQLLSDFVQVSCQCVAECRPSFPRLDSRPRVQPPGRSGTLRSLRKESGELSRFHKVPGALCDVREGSFPAPGLHSGDV